MPDKTAMQVLFSPDAPESAKARALRKILEHAVDVGNKLDVDEPLLVMPADRPKLKLVTPRAVPEQVK